MNYRGPLVPQRPQLHQLQTYDHSQTPQYQFQPPAPRQNISASLTPTGNHSASVPNLAGLENIMVDNLMSSMNYQSAVEQSQISTID